MYQDCQGDLHHSNHVALITPDRVVFVFEVFHPVRVAIRALGPSVLGGIRFPELDISFVCLAITNAEIAERRDA